MAKEKKIQRYKATWNARIGGTVRAVTVTAVKKGKKFYSLDGGEVPAHAKIEKEYEN